MNPNVLEPSNMNFFDQLRLRNGVTELRDTFDTLIPNNMEKALNFINSGNLQFPSLFVLQPEIRKKGILDRLNQRNKLALEISDGILSAKEANLNHLSRTENDEYHSVLRWIFETGYTSDGLNSHFDEVLDKTAIMLVKVYNDRTCLKYIEKVIFERYKKGSFIYDLVWAFFESRSPKCLYMTSKRLLSDNPRDIELVRKLLGFIPCFGPNCPADNVKQYRDTVNWLDENIQFMYYTGEHFLQTFRPCPFTVSLELKYLQRAACSESQRGNREYSRDELTYLKEFTELDPATKVILSDFSNSLRKKSKHHWNRWIGLPVSKQIEAAKKMRGAFI